MERQGEEVHVTTEEASGGAPPQGVRYVLVISLFLVIAALSAIWIFGAYSAQRHAEPAGTSQVEGARQAS